MWGIYIDRISTLHSPNFADFEHHGIIRVPSEPPETCFTTLLITRLFIFDYLKITTDISKMLTFED